MWTLLFSFKIIFHQKWWKFSIKNFISIYFYFISKFYLKWISTLHTSIFTPQVSTMNSSHFFNILSSIKVRKIQSFIKSLHPSSFDVINLEETQLVSMEKHWGKMLMRLSKAFDIILKCFMPSSVFRLSQAPWKIFTFHIYDNLLPFFSMKKKKLYLFSLIKIHIVESHERIYSLLLPALYVCGLCNWIMNVVKKKIKIKMFMWGIKMQKKMKIFLSVFFTPQ